ncbi:hypothetical protein QJQ45_022661 [Haematococcus lacustris]|nr:hypothetical protein QJQ45_022661 [Haematococcus lacustris]
MSECTTVLMDNSEWTRSGDYAPTRFQAQADAVNLLAGAKTQSHPENTVGVLTMAGRTPQVLVTPTSDLGKVLNCMSEIDVEGESNFTAAVQIAQLALKHRQNKNQRQRIVIFDTLVKIAKKLKKNSVAVDIISFGSESENEEKLAAFLEAVNSNNNSHLVTCPPGPVLSDVLIGSPIFQGEGGGFGYGSGGPAAGGSGGDAGGFEFGVDPSMDPELALALRVSMEEERARQNAMAAAAAAAAAVVGGAAAGSSDASGTAPAAADGAAPSTPSAATAVAGSSGVEDMDEDTLLQQALAMSMAMETEAEATPAPMPGGVPGSAPPAPAPPPAAAGDGGMYDDVEDEELRRALAMSLQDHAGPASKEDEKPADQ